MVKISFDDWAPTQPKQPARPDSSAVSPSQRLTTKEVADFTRYFLGSYDGQISDEQAAILLACTTVPIKIAVDPPTHNYWIRYEAYVRFATGVLGLPLERYKIRDMIREMCRDKD